MTAETTQNPDAARRAADPPVAWQRARALAYAAGRSAAPASIRVPLTDADGLTLAEPLRALADLPAFPTSSVDGWAVRGPAPWRPVGRVLAGGVPAPLTGDGTAVEIATGAMVPEGTSAVVRVEDSRRTEDGSVTGEPRPNPDWREPGEEASAGEVLLPAGVPVTPAVIGFAASCGHDTLPVHPAPRAVLVVFGDELLTGGPPGAGRVRDALGPALPAWLRRMGVEVRPAIGPVTDTLDAHVEAIRGALSGADLVCTTGGTMHGPVDHLHPALRELGAEYVVNTVAVRPGFPMLLARLRSDGGRDQFLAGLPGNPQSAVVALMSLVAPLLTGLLGRAEPTLPLVELGAPVPGRGDYTHLALVTVRPADGTAYPLRHVGSAMLRGLAGADGFAVIRPGTSGERGTRVPFVPLPLLTGERP